MKNLTKLSMVSAAFVAAFAFSGPAQAGDNAFSEWLCGGVDGCDSGGDRNYLGQFGELEPGLITPAHAADEWNCFFGDCVDDEGRPRRFEYSIKDLQSPEAFSFIPPAHAGDTNFNPTCGVAGCIDQYGNPTDADNPAPSAPNGLLGSLSVVTPAHAADEWNCLFAGDCFDDETGQQRHFEWLIEDPEESATDELFGSLSIVTPAHAADEWNCLFANNCADETGRERYFEWLIEDPEDME